MSFSGWSNVAGVLDDIARHPPTRHSGGMESPVLDPGQCASVAELARRIHAGQRGQLIADEVGMGKTRIAAALIHAVRSAGGRAAVVLPPGLGVQWQAELRRFDPQDRTLLPLRSYESFIAGFLHDTDGSGKTFMKERWERHLQDRRQQRELPEHGWSNEGIVLLSHTFASMRFQRGTTASANDWRRKLLPWIAAFVSGRRPAMPKGNGAQYAQASHRAAKAIAEIITANALSFDPAIRYATLTADRYRDDILKPIGYGLGQFDLVVIDEAHKARGEDSSLERILGPVTWESADSFRLGMTATPVELGVTQWTQTLRRITGRDHVQSPPGSPDIEEVLRRYVEIVGRIQTEELDTDLTAQFEQAASAFQATLAPFVLRRDKRSDPELYSFTRDFGDYRCVQDLRIEAGGKDSDLDRKWLRRFCASEALSLLPQDDSRLKRLRLSITRGSGLSVFDEPPPEQRGSDDLPHDGVLVTAGLGDAIATNSSVQTMAWQAALGGIDTDDLHEHPAILRTVEFIEENYTEKGQKVLVFGRFLAPLDALTRLLDAREMLRRLSKGRRWPAKAIPEASRPAVLSALKSPLFARCFSGIDDVESRLDKGYTNWSNERKKELKTLHTEVEHIARNNSDPAIQMLDAILRHDADRNDTHLHITTGRLLEALDERRPNDTTQPWSGGELVSCFQSLLSELSTDSDQDDAEQEQLIEKLNLHLQDYSGREGNFARMMWGQTKAQTRRLLQSGFNRPDAWPMVLVAQSTVGREGLNLHEACRTVVLLHAEWNPGVVEQQIGRVDRKNSQWLHDARQWLADPDRQGAAPRIMIHPVIVEGTYDDYNWQVLKRRWRALRAQLHGDVLPEKRQIPSDVSDSRNGLINRVRQATPDFSPPSDVVFTGRGGSSSGG